jgi:NYN domain
VLLSDSVLFRQRLNVRCIPRFSFLNVYGPLVGQCRDYKKRVKVKKSRVKVKIVVKTPHRAARTRLDSQVEKRSLLQAKLIQQYEEKQSSTSVNNARQLGQKFEEDALSSSQETSQRSTYDRHSRLYDDDVQCGIFWDIENVPTRYLYFAITLIYSLHPPAIVIEAIRDFAGARLTPVFQAYTSRPANTREGRINAIYSQLGVTFIQCFGLGKDTADKKIISDMWKFYASFQKISASSKMRVVLITGDRDFADTIGQLRNLGVEVGILTGHVRQTAPVYDDYTLGMRVLPLLGIIKARARDNHLNTYQAAVRDSLSDFQDGKGSTYLQSGD